MFNVKSLLISLSLILAACTPKERGPNEILIGTITGPETALVEVAKQEAAKHGLTLKIITFEDYIMPNTALAEGEIDANMFQHQPYLDVVREKQKYQLTPIGKMFIYPMGIYSHKHTQLSQLPEGAIIGLPNDPSNAARALRLLAKAKLIEIQDVNDLELTPQKITHNPKHFQFKEINAAQLPRVLNDLDAAAINTNYAIPAHLIPSQDALFIEDKDSPYVNIVVVRTQDKDNPKYRQLMEALHSQAVRDAANQLFHKEAIAAW